MHTVIKININQAIYLSFGVSFTHSTKELEEITCIFMDG